MYLVRISAPAPCGRNRGADITWESRTLPDSMKRKDLPERVGLFFSYNRKVLFFQIAPTNVQHCTWLASSPCADCGGFSMGMMPGRAGQSQTNVWGFFFVPSLLPSFRLCSTKSENVLGAAIERALWAAQLWRSTFYVTKGHERERTG